MKSETETTEEIAAVKRALRARMAKYALYSIENVDARTATILQRNELLTETGPGPAADATVEVILDAEHPDRIPVTHGPMIFHRVKGNDSEQIAFPVVDFLFHVRQEVRMAALAHFLGMVNPLDELMTPITQAVIVQRTEDLNSSEPELWRGAAIAITDAISDDFLCNLAGVRQSIEMHLDDRDYFPRVMRPSFVSLNSIHVPVPKPSEQHSEIEIIIDKAIQGSDNLQQACDHYYRVLGFLPLSKPFSMSRLVNEWLKRKEAGADAWADVWEWVQTSVSPLANYHACTVFANSPELIPGGQYVNLWQKFVSNIRLPNGEDVDDQTNLLWYIRCELAKHYTRHIECHFPGMDGERIIVCAWWLAEKVSLVFGKSPKFIHHVLESAIQPEVNRSTQVHLFAHPPIVPSAARYATLYLRSLWGLSLLCQIGPNIADLKPEDMSKDNLSLIGDLVTIHILNGFPRHETDQDKATYGFEQTHTPSASIWTYLDDSSNSKQLLATVKSSNDSDDTEALQESLKKFPGETEWAQKFIARDLLIRAYTNDLPDDLVWAWVSAQEWRHDVLLKADLDALGILSDALLETQVQRGGKWVTELPHIFALGCEDALEDKERREFLFGITVFSSLSSNTLSAIDRLLSGKHKNTYVDEVAHWRRQLGTASRISVPWVSARIRGILSTLHIT